jgi:hypothetical protein
MNIKHKTIHRVRITGKLEDQGRAYRYVLKHGLHIVSAGFMPVRKLRGYEPKRFAITAEKEGGR